MITEDYVSFETAKLLKEKGFDEPCHALYHDGDDKIFFGLDEDSYFNSILNVDCYACPTLQMARKWLREKHNLHIEIRLTNHSISSMVNVIKYYWVMTNTETGRWCDESTIYTVKAFDTPEEAEEDAIKHALKKLD